jgi:HAMP domain-containing protein
MSKSIKTKKKGSFRRNVIATFLVISLVSLGATGAISWSFIYLMGDYTTGQSSTSLQDQILTHMSQTAEKTASVISQKLATAESLINALAEEFQAQMDSSATFSPRETYYDYFFENNIAGLFPSDTHPNADYGLNVSWDYSSWYIQGSTSANWLTYNATHSERLGRVSNMDYLFKYVHEQLAFRWLYIAFTDGLFINYPGSIFAGNDADRISDPYDPTGEDWYIDIENGHGQIQFVSPYYDEFERVLMISIGKMVYQGAVPMGVISGDITIQDIRDKIINVTVLNTGYAALINRDGDVVAHPEVGDEEYALGLPAITQVETNPDGSSALTSAQVDQIRLVSEGVTGSLTYMRNGTSRLMVYTPVGRGDYICVISVPQKEALEAIPPLEARIALANQEAATFILFVTVGGIVLAGVVAVAISNTITKPLQYLMDLATRNVAARIREAPLDTQDLQVDATYMSKDDEIGELARAFQGMLDTIREDES